MSPLSIRLLFAASLCLPAVCVQAAGATAPHAARRSDAATQFHRLLDDHWEWSMREFPGQATAIGDHRYDDRLTDLSAAGVARRKQMHAQFLARLKGIDAGTLRGQDSVSYAVFAYNLRTDATIDAIYGKLPFSGDDSWLPLSTMGGIHTQVAAMPRLTRFDTAADYRAYLKRLNGLPRQIDHVIASLQAGIDSGWMPAAVAVARVPQQLDTHLETDLEKNLVYAPFRKFAADIPAAEQAALAEAGRQAVLQSVVPAFRKLKTFYETQYLPRARKELAASTLPGGMPFYQAMIGRMTTTGLNAQQIHDTGLAEVARITADMDATVKEAGFQGTRAEFIRFLNTDPRFLYTRTEDMLAGYRDIAKRADAALPAYFAELPRLPYGIRAMQAWEGDNAEHYTPGAATVRARLVRSQRAQPEAPQHAVDGVAGAARGGAGPPPADRPCAGAAGRAEVPPQRLLQRLHGRLGAVRRNAGQGNGPVHHAVRALRPSAAGDAPRRAAGGRHRHPRARLGPRPFDRVSRGDRRPEPCGRHRRDRPLHQLAGPGAGLQAGPAAHHGAAREGQGGARGAFRYPPLP
jgi:hypothetical protein